jgi:outer membrane receptor for ferrienterochelin and colicins
MLTCVAPAFAQSAAVAGRVVDESGAVIPGAVITLTAAGQRQETTADAAGAFRFQNVRAGTYQLTVTLSGFQRSTETVTVTDREADVTVTLKLGGLDETVVVSASKLESALIDAPATMSVLPGEAITASPAQNYGDLLRSVPGVNVIQLSARDINITARQATSTLANSQLALLDGRSIYLDFFGLVLWDFVPNNTADIKQIEVVRGPASVVWGANALTGVVNIITRPPRETTGGTFTLTGGGFSRGAGSTDGKGPGGLFGVSGTFAQAVSDRVAYRLSAGYYHSEALPRPIGLIPVVRDPRDPSKQVGGGSYPADGDGPIGTAFRNSGTSQPKFDLRVDQEVADGGRITYGGGVAGTEGMIYTGLGPFDIQPGSLLGYVKTAYTKGALKASVFANFLDAEAPNLLAPLQLNFKTQTIDAEIGHATVINSRHALSYGANVRRNNFDITLAPTSENRTELGAYVQDEIFVDRFRFAIGARVDKFGNLDDPAFSPRLAAIFKPAPDHAIRASFNRAFRSPSVINQFLEVAIVAPADLRGLAPFLGPLAPLVARPFPLTVRAVGSELPIGSRAQTPLKEESLTAYEIAYTGTVARRTTLGLAFYVNDVDDNINFVQLPATADPYTAASPPPGWQLPPSILGVMAQLGIFLPRTAFTYLNLGPVRNKGIELSVDQRLSRWLTAFANYSWQGKPNVLDDPNPYPRDELSFPPTHRFNAGAMFNGSRLVGSLGINYSDGAFWSDVLNAPFHGFTDGFTMVNGSVGWRWKGGRVTTTLKSTNMFNEKIQQHVFGDIVTRQVVAEVRLAY